MGRPRTDEQTVVDAARGGDPAAFEALYQAHGGAVLRFLRGITGNEQDARDLHQETWSRVHHHLARQRGSFPAWLYTIARNLAWQWRRSAARAPTRPLDKMALPAHAPAPDSALDVDRLLRALRPEDAEILLLREHVGLKYAEIAEIYGIPLNTVKSRLHTARQHAREAGDDLGLRWSVALLACELEPGPLLAVKRSRSPVRSWWRRRKRTVIGGIAGGGVVAGVAVGVGMLWTPVQELLEATASSQPPPSMIGRSVSMVPIDPDLVGPIDAEPMPIDLCMSADLWSPSMGHLRAEFRGPHPWSTWPAPEELPSTAGPDARAMAAAVFNSDETAHRALSERLRHSPLPDEPWDALAVLEAVRFRADADHTRAKRRSYAQHPLPDGAVMGDAAWRAWAAARPPVPKRDNSRLYPLAQEVERRWPDHAVAEHAALYRLATLMADRADAAAADGLVGLIEGARDPRVARFAALQYSYTYSPSWPEKVSPRHADVLAGFLDDEPGLRSTRHELASAVMASRLAIGDIDAALAWAPRYHREVEQFCATESPKLYIEGDTTYAASFSCDAARSVRDVMFSWLVVHGLEEPWSWRAGLLAEVRRCHIEVGQPYGNVYGDATWEDGWRWDAWSRRSDFTDCVEAATPGGPPPPRGTRVALDSRLPHPLMTAIVAVRRLMP